MNYSVPPKGDRFTREHDRYGSRAFIGGQIISLLNQGMRVTLRKAPELKGFECIVTRPPDDAKFFCGETLDAAIARAIDRLNTAEPPTQTITLPTPGTPLAWSWDWTLRARFDVRIENGEVTVVEATP